MASQRLDEEATPAEGGLVHLRGPTVRWVNSRLDGVYNIERVVSLNKSMHFNRDDGTILFCLLISSGHEFVATICAGTGSYAVEIKTYKTGDNAMMETWSSRVVFASPAGASVRAGNSYASLDGYISNDGERALIHYVVDYGESMCYTTTNSGNRWIQSRFPKFDSHMVSGDDEHIFFTGRGLAESARGQIIEAYSTRTWKLSASWTFACQPGFRHGNHSMLRSLFVDRAICCAFDASGSFDADQRLCVIGLSNGDQFHIQLDQYRASSSIYVSPDRHHMVHIPEDDGQIMYWDLKKPTYEPLFTSELPKVEKASRWVHRINGKDTVVRSSMHKQVRYCRFSHKGEVVTVAVGNDYCVVINSFLTHNFQLVYQKFFNHELCPGWVIMSIEISDGRGVSVIGAVPNKGDEAGVFGLLASFVVVPDAYDEIRELEEHFDNAESNISLVAEGGGTKLHRWGITDGTLEHDAGPTVVMTESDRTQQSKLDLAMFRNQYATSPAQPVQSRITHLLTVNYPWSRTAQTSIFLIRMKSTHYVVAVGSPSIDRLQPEITRVLYVSDFSSQYHPDQLEIVQVGKQLILKVWPFPDISDRASPQSTGILLTDTNS